MELTPRKQAVLKAIVKAYIETGEPIGSKNLVAMLENAPSSATLRNEMNELCSLGFLNQPHTSAGRIPTSNGYRFYVNSLNQSPLSDKVKEYIDRSFRDIRCEPEIIPNKVAEILSKLTGMPAISCLITERPSTIKKVELLPIGRSTVMLLIITNDGRTRNRIFRFKGDFTDNNKETFQKVINNRIKGKPVNELNLAYMQSVIAELGIYSLDLMPLITAVFESASEIENTDVSLSGETALYNICGDEIIASKILALIKQRDPIISMLESINGSVGTVFGDDTAYNELTNDTLIAAKFDVDNRYRGYVGVIGPNRMSYDKIIPGIEYTAKKLADIMNNAQQDMED